MIFYFHGFLSSSLSWKAQLLKKTWPNQTIDTPDLPIDPSEVEELIAAKMAAKNRPHITIGSSLGGFYALFTSGTYHIPAILINPSLQPWLSLAPALGLNKNYYSGMEFEWRRKHLAALKKMNQNLKQVNLQQSLLYFFLAEDDEVLDHSAIPDLFPNAGLIRFYGNCQHRFNRFQEIIPDLNKIIQNSRSKHNET